MKRVTALKRLNQRFTRSSKLSIYRAFIRPILEFGWQLYINCSKEVLNTLEKVQRASLLLVTSAYKKTSKVNLLKETGIPILTTRRQTQQATFTHNHFYNKLPPYIDNLIPDTIQDNTQYNLRNKQGIIIPRLKKSFFLFLSLFLNLSSHRPLKNGITYR